MTATTKMCPFCLSDVPGEASRCRHCTGDFAAKVTGPDLGGFWVGGLLLTVIGLAVAVGSAGGNGEWLGYLAAGVGATLLQIAVIAWGVSVGLRDRDRRTHVQRYTNAAVQTESTAD